MIKKLKARHKKHNILLCFLLMLLLYQHLDIISQFQYVSFVFYYTDNSIKLLTKMKCKREEEKKKEIVRLMKETKNKSKSGCLSSPKLTINIFKRELRLENETESDVGDFVVL